MGFLSRFKQAYRSPRHDGSGALWDNVNSGNVSKKTLQTTMSGNATTANRDNVFVQGPNPEPYLRTGSFKDPDRLHARFIALQPRVSVIEPKSGLYNTVYDDPQQPRSTAQPQNLTLNPGMPGVMFAPTQVRQREQLYDAAAAATIRTNQSYTPSQVYFNQKEPLPEFTVPSKFSHSVYTNQAQLKRGWYQAEVPEPGERRNIYGSTPPVHLSTPISVKTMNISSMSGHRSPIKNGKAPQRVRSGG